MDCFRLNFNTIFFQLNVSGKVVLRVLEGFVHGRVLSAFDVRFQVGVALKDI